ncbi:MAG: hypothetical protein ACAH89_04245 [Rariglobus sp.]|nr:hypothetical protein [Rariglobus sp.]
MSKLWHIPLWLLTAATLAWIGHGLLFTSFMLYDDEGYVLLTLRNQIEHGGLYDVVYTQYGPFFYAVLGGLSRILDFEWTNTSGRWFTLVNWLAASGLCGLLVWLRSRLWPAVLFTVVNVFAMLWIMLQEPGHPGGLITALVAATALAGSEFIGRDRPRLFAFCIGGLGAFVALTKINAGAFLLMAGGLWLLATQSGRLRGPALAVSLAVAAAAPFLLMRPLMDQAWVPTFALLVALSSVAAVITTSECGNGRSAPSHILWFAGAATGATLLVVAWSLAQGTSLHGLLHGVILAPLQHPDIYSFPVKWRPLVVPSAITGLGLVIAWAARPGSSLVLHAVALARVAAALTSAFALLPWSGTSVAVLALCYGVPAAALFSIPLHKQGDRTSDLVRPWLALLFVLQSMQAFPIAGSQLNWGTFLWIPLMVLGLADTINFWAARVRIPWSRVFGALFAVAACGLVVLQIYQYIRIQKSRALDGIPLGLPGAENIMLPVPVASALHVISANAHWNAGTLFSLPGVFSFNQWSGRPTPTLRNVTHWFSLLSEREQQEIIDTMAADPRSAFVLQRHLIVFLTDRGFPVRGPLISYLRTNYHESISVDGYSFWVRNGREISPYSMATWEPASSGQRRIGINLPPCSEPVAHLEAAYYDEAAPPLPSTDTTSGQGSLNPFIQSIDEQGNTTGPISSVTWPIPPGGSRRLTFNFSTPPEAPQERHWVFRLVAADGRTLGFARFSNRR